MPLLKDCAPIGMDRLASTLPYLRLQRVREVIPAFENRGEVPSVEQHQSVVLGLPIPIDCR